MTSDISKAVVDAIRKLYRNNPLAQQLFDWTAQRERDATSTSVDRLMSRLGISRGDAVALARALEHAGCGQFIVGRRGQPSRFEWKFSCISLGQSAAGEDVKIEAAEDPLPESEEERLETAGAAPDRPLTLAQAKIALSKSLGVPIENIEITIKA